MSTLQSNFNTLKNLFNQKLGVLQALKDRVNACTDQISQLNIKEENIAKASLFLQSLSDQTRLQVLDKISGIVTDALQTVKDQNMVFQMQLVTKNNQPTLEMNIFDKKTEQTYDILSSLGGGVADIVSFVLRVALLVKWQPFLSRIIIADECGKFVSVQDQALFAEFNRKLSEQLGLQIIWISHSDVLTSQAHKIFEITKLNGVSRVEEKTTIQ